MDSDGTAARDTRSALRSAPPPIQNDAANAATEAAHANSSRTDLSSAARTATSTDPQGVHVGLRSSAHISKVPGSIPGPTGSGSRTVRAGMRATASSSGVAATTPRRRQKRRAIS